MQHLCVLYRRLLRVVQANNILTALVLGGASIAFGVFVGTYSHKVIVPFPALVAHYPAERGNPLNFLAEYDSLHYIHIAQHGYTDPTLPAFFPLYPLLLRMVAYIVRSPLVAGLLVSWSCLIGAVYYYLKIARSLWPEKQTDSIRAAALFVIFPTAVFLIAAYTESLFALVSLAALYYGIRKQYVPATLMTALATATHADGLFVVLLVGAMALFEHKTSIIRVAAIVAGGCTGIAMYAAFLYVQFHNPLQFLRAEKSWGRLQGNYLHQLIATCSIFNLTMVVLLLITVFYWVKRRPSFSFYTAAFLLIPLGTGLFYDFNRYALMAFPLQLMLYEKARKSVLGFNVLCFLFGVFWCYFLVQYASGYITG